MPRSAAREVPDSATQYDSGMRPRTICLALCFAALSARAELSPLMHGWNRPVEPFRIVGNVWYVGTNELASYLIVTPEGLILLDTALRESVPIVEKNLEALGYGWSDVKLLLGSHAHFDHVGGMAEVKRLTGAPLVVARLDAPGYLRGDRDNHAWGDENVFEPVKPDRLVEHGEEVTLGGVVMRANVTPGHTEGCTTWSTRVRDGEREYDVVFVGSSSVPGYQLVGNPKAPDLVAQYHKGFRVLESLACDVFLAAHGGFFGLEEKRAQLATSPASNPFVDPDGYRRHVQAMKASFEKKVATQTAEIEIDEIYRRFAAAYDQLDAAAVAALYEKDALYLTPNENSGVARGEAIGRSFASFFDAVKSEGGRLAIRFTIIDRQIDGDLATDVGYFELKRVDKESGAMIGKFTTVARRQAGGGWKFRVDSYAPAPRGAFDEAKGRVIP